MNMHCHILWNTASLFNYDYECTYYYTLNIARNPATMVVGIPFMFEPIQWSTRQIRVFTCLIV